MITPSFSVAHASARPSGWQKACSRALLTASEPRAVEYVLSVDERFGNFNSPDVWSRFGWFQMLRLGAFAPRCAVPNWNNAIDATRGDVIIVNSDDFAFPCGWDTSLADALKGRDPLADPFVVRVSTGSPRDRELFTIQIFSRALYNLWGYGLWPEYESLYVDDDFTQHAMADPRVTVVGADYLLFEHLHFAFGKSAKDAVYEHENRQESAHVGAQVFARRKAANFQ